MAIVIHLTVLSGLFIRSMPVIIAQTARKIELRNIFIVYNVFC